MLVATLLVLPILTTTTKALEVKLLQCPAVPLLNRCYFKMGPRFWTSANAIVMGTTVLGQDSHPGYKLMNICAAWLQTVLKGQSL